MDAPKEKNIIIKLNGATLTVDNVNMPYGPEDTRVFLSPPERSSADRVIDRDGDFVIGKIVLFTRPKFDDIVMLREFAAKHLRFVEPYDYARDNIDGYTWIPESGLQSWLVQFLDIPGMSYKLRADKDLRIEDKDGNLRSLQLYRGSIRVRYSSTVTDVRVGEYDNLVSIMPSYLNYLKSRPFINSVYAATASALTIVLAMLSWWGRSR